MTTHQDEHGNISAYPLQWPTGWKRTPLSERQRASFNRKQHAQITRSNGTTYNRLDTVELSIYDAVGRVLIELRGFGVSRENAILSTNLEMRLDGLPRSSQRAPSDSGAAVYWTRDAEQRCMAIDQYDRVADNLAAIAATLNDLRSIERHGGAEIINRAFYGFAQLAPPAPPNWWDVLGVSPRASGDEIREAYRRLAFQFHPDQGGDAEKFIRVQHAYEQAMGQ